MSVKPFQAKPGGSITVANGTSASAAASLDEGCETVGLTNTSATAIAYFRCDSVVTDAQAVPAVTVATGLPILPMNQIRVTVGLGKKLFTAIASAADGNLIITPGQGD